MELRLRDSVGWSAKCIASRRVGCFIQAPLDLFQRLAEQLEGATTSHGRDSPPSMLNRDAERFRSEAVWFPSDLTSLLRGCVESRCGAVV